MAEQMAKKYYCWGGMSSLSARTAGGAPTTASLMSRSWPAHGGGEKQPSWEELAFARDAAGHLVWPPRSYTCTFCRREFRSAQALGGHMNVHRRDRARLRQQCASSPDHLEDDDDQAPPHNHPAINNNLLVVQQPQGGDESSSSLLFSRAKPISLSAACDHHQQAAAAASHGVSTIMRMRESKNKLVISIPAVAAGMSKEAALAIDYEEEEIIVAAESRKRRRLHHPKEHQQPQFLRPPPPQLSKGAIDQHDDATNKVPNKVIMTTSPSPNSLHLAAAGRQEVDLELRLGTS